VRMEARAKSDGGKIMGTVSYSTGKSGSTERASEGDRLCQYQGCRLGAAQQCAKQKAFVTLLAMAPAPAFYWAAKKSHGRLGDFFAALKKRERREVEGRGITKAKQGEPAKAGCFKNY